MHTACSAVRIQVQRGWEGRWNTALQAEGVCEALKSPVLAGWAPTTKHRGLGSLNNRPILSHTSGGWKSKIKVLAGLVFPEASLLGL